MGRLGLPTIAQVHRKALVRLDRGSREVGMLGMQEPQKARKRAPALVFHSATVVGGCLERESCARIWPDAVRELREDIVQPGRVVGLRGLARVRATGSMLDACSLPSSRLSEHASTTVVVLVVVVALPIRTTKRTGADETGINCCSCASSRRFEPLKQVAQRPLLEIDQQRNTSPHNKHAEFTFLALPLAPPRVPVDGAVDAHHPGSWY
ncbi:hypothetical protein Q7P37_005743 [Cladosporium fusiforme]